MATLNTVKVLDINITSNFEDEILEFIITRLKNTDKKTRIFTPNPEIITFANAHPEFKKLINEAEVTIPDGIGVVLAAHILGKSLQGRIAGVNFMQKLCEKCVKEAVSIGLLGGKGGVAEATAECLMKQYPGLKIDFVGEEWSEEGFAKARKLRFTNYDLRIGKKEQTETVNKAQVQDRNSLIINHKSIGILFVAFGFPKQERWISENIDKLPIQAAMSVGGAFDFLSGKVSRAPGWVQAIGFEWLYRLIRQPWRWKRQLSLITFVLLIIKHKFQK